MISAYLDESYSSGRLQGICIAGIFYKDKEAQRLGRQWKGVLRRSGIDFFHMKEQAHCKGQFEKKSHDEADEIYQELLRILRHCTLGSRAVCYVPDIYDLSIGPAASIPYSPYTLCSYICMSLILSKADRLGHKQIKFFIEQGHKNENELRRLIRQQLIEDAQWRSMVKSYRFVGKTDSPVSQTADIMAYEYWKRISDLAKKRDGSEGPKIRKSLESIIVLDDKRDNHRLGVLQEDLLRRIPILRSIFRTNPISARSMDHGEE